MKIARLPSCIIRLSVFPILFFLSWSWISFGQGLLLDDQAHEAQPRMAVYDDGNKAELESLKGVYKVDLKPYCPAPQDQGLISSCTGWASGYGALTIMKAIEMGWEGKRDLITTNALSALFIYNQIKKGSCEFGAYMSDAAILVRDKGDALSKDYDKLKNKCDKLPSDQELKDALSYKIRDFVSLFSSGDAGNLKVLRTKMSLAQHKPVVVGMSLLKNFQTIRSGTEYWYPQIGDTTANGGHALVVIGFDDGREAFEVMNSWGSAWANNGFVWIKYRDFARYSHYGYIFIGNKDDSGFYDLTASMVIRKPAYTDSGELIFNELPVVFRNGAYELNGQTLRKGDLLQPFLSQVKRDAYFYAFSVDARGSIHVHWPRDAVFDSEFEGSHESAIITIPKIDLAIPNKYGALRLSTPGIEYWCFLVSESPIVNLNQYLLALKNNMNPDFVKRIKKVFGNALIPGDRVRYAQDLMQVESDTKQQEIVPVVLKIIVGN